MKLLKLKVISGYKMLANDFEINFLTKTRVDKDVPNNELLELEDNLYYPIETIFIGKNSSGKTTTIELLDIIFDFFRTGRICANGFNDASEFKFETTLYSEGYIYNYVGAFKKDSSINRDFLIIESEELGKNELKANYKKDLSNASFLKVPDFKSNSGGDTSSISRILLNRGFNFLVNKYSDARMFGIYFDMFGAKTFDALLHLFDDGVDYIRPHKNELKQIDGFVFKRVSAAREVVVEPNYLETALSQGTIRGICLYGLSILAFKNGGTILVDEIEKSFNRNLIENLFLMFNDKSINKKDASIIYSTHYSELLDGNNRCDNVNVLHRKDNEITLMNMSEDYNCRTDMLKSTQFNQNVFDTLINYDRLMDLKESLR